MLNQTQRLPTPYKGWSPEGLPWTAKRKGTDTLVWYVIYDCSGDEIFNTGSVYESEESRVRAEVYWMLSKVNDSKIITVDGEQVEVTWK